MSDKPVNLDPQVLVKTPPGNLQENSRVEGRQFDLAKGTPSGVGEEERRTPETSAIARNVNVSDDGKSPEPEDIAGDTDLQPQLNSGSDSGAGGLVEATDPSVIPVDGALGGKDISEEINVSNVREAAEKPRGLWEKFKLLSLGQKIAVCAVGALVVAGGVAVGVVVGGIAGPVIGALAGMAAVAAGIVAVLYLVHVIGEANANAESLRNAIDGLKIQNRQLSNVISEQRKTVTELQNGIENCGQRVQQVQGQLDKAQGQTTELASKIVALEEDHQAKEEQLRRENTQLREENEKLVARTRELSSVGSQILTMAEKMQGSFSAADSVIGLAIDSLNNVTQGLVAMEGKVADKIREVKENIFAKSSGIESLTKELDAKLKGAVEAYKAKCASEVPQEGAVEDLIAVVVRVLEDVKTIADKSRELSESIKTGMEEIQRVVSEEIAAMVEKTEGDKAKVERYAKVYFESKVQAAQLVALRENFSKLQKKIDDKYPRSQGSKPGRVIYTIPEGKREKFDALIKERNSIRGLIDEHVQTLKATQETMDTIKRENADLVTKTEEMMEQNIMMAKVLAGYSSLTARLKGVSDAISADAAKGISWTQVGLAALGGGVAAATGVGPLLAAGLTALINVAGAGVAQHFG